MQLAEILASTGTAMPAVAGASTSREVTSVALVDRSADLREQRADALVILTRDASRELTGFRLDVAVRMACDARLGALVVTTVAELSTTAMRLAERGDLALVTLNPDTSPGDLLLRVDRALNPDATARLARLGDVLHVVEAPHASVDALVSAANAALGAPLASSAVASRLVADAVARLEARERASGERSARAAARLLDLLLAPGPVPSAGADDLARRLGVAIDATHRVLRLSCGAVETTDRVVAIVQGVVRGEPGWLVGAVDVDVVAVRSTGTATTSDGARRVAELVVLRAGSGEEPIVVRAGIGGAYAGPDGVRASAAEAALALRSPGNRAVVVHDATGIGRVLAEWSATGAGARAIADALAPLAALEPARARAAIVTLSAYLDARGSLVAAGRTLHLHPNAVAYRIARIRRHLDSGLDEPDERLMLQLACRAWLASGLRSTGGS